MLPAVNGDPAGAAVERDGDAHALRLGLQLRPFPRDRAGRPVRGEALDMDPVLGDVAVEQRAFGRIHHRPGPADEPAVDLGRIGDQLRDRLIAAARGRACR